MGQDPHQVFDGQERYRAHSASWLAMLFSPADPRASLGAFGVLLGALAFAALALNLWWIGSSPLGRVFALMAVVVMAVIGASLGGYFTRGAAYDTRQRMAVSLVLICWSVSVAVFPFTFWKPASAAAQPMDPAFNVPDAQRLPLTADDEAWLADVYAAGVHAPAGVVPPMLEVHEDEGIVDVKNVSGRTLSCVRLSRGSTAWKHESCRLKVGYRDPQCESLAPGGTLTFSAPRGAVESCYTAPLSFEIGDAAHPEPSWWSDGALEAWMAWHGLRL
jgi:hypothetical protein